MARELIDRWLVLSKVRGLLAPNPETEHPPIDFILRGRNPATRSAQLGSDHFLQKVLAFLFF